MSQPNPYPALTCQLSANCISASACFRVLILTFLCCVWPLSSREYLPVDKPDYSLTHFPEEVTLPDQFIIVTPQSCTDGSVSVDYEPTFHWRKGSSCLTCLRGSSQVESGLIPQDLIVIRSQSSIHAVTIQVSARLWTRKIHLPSCFLSYPGHLSFTRLHHPSDFHWLHNSSTLLPCSPSTASLTTRWLL